jgi:general secretion pathway protein C
MGRYLSWLANGALFALCCFLVASTANTVLAALLAPAPAELAAVAAPPPTTGTSWDDRQVILSRNLFNASLLSPSAPEPTDDLADLEATSLPLVLLGTYNATNNPDDSWAAIEDQETREHLVLRLRDDVKGGKASVVRIERKRIVLDENGKLRVLEFDEGDAAAVAAMPPALAARRARRTAAAPPRRPPVVAPPAAEPSRNPAQLLAGGRPMPKYQDGEMVGFTVSNIEPGSLYERAGLHEGDLITEVNGVALNDPQQGARFVMEFAQAEAVTLTVQRADGTTESVDVPLP